MSLTAIGILSFAEPYLLQHVCEIINGDIPHGKINGHFKIDHMQHNVYMQSRSTTG